MNKKIFKIILLFLIFGFIRNVYAQNQNTLLFQDEANLLSFEETVALKEQMKSLLSYGNIGFVTTNSNGYRDTKTFARNYYYDHFGTRSGTIFFIDMSKREIFIYSDGSNFDIITSNKASIITDNNYRYAKKELYYECASKSFSQIYKLLSGHKIIEPMRYFSNFIISIFLGFLFAFCFAILFTREKLTSEKKILRHMLTYFNIKNINVEKTKKYKVLNEPVSSSGYSGRDSSRDRSSYSSGGSSGGGFSSGGRSSSGGGGGHRF